MLYPSHTTKYPLANQAADHARLASAANVKSQSSTAGVIIATIIACHIATSDAKDRQRDA